MVWTAFVALVVTAPGEPSALPVQAKAEVANACVIRRERAWLIEETSNFQVWSQLSQDQHEEVAEQCEACRTQLQKSWFGDDCERCWTPKCQIVLNPTVNAYNRALNHVNDQSVGCTTLTTDGGRVVKRRIDLRMDAASWRSSALPHELTHVVMASELGNAPLAPWVDEGMAVLAEAAEYQDRRDEALRRAEARGHVFTASQLMTLTQPPRPEYRDAFYGQSGSLVKFLLAHAGREKFIDFLRASNIRGQDVALREMYSIRDTGQLHKLWIAAGRESPMNVAQDDLKSAVVPD